MLNLLAIGTGALVGIIAAVIVLLIVIAVIVWYIKTHNAFVTLDAQTDEAFSTIDVYLKKRYDLIPNLVETVKGYAKHESETLQKVIDARAKLKSATSPNDVVKADMAMSRAIRGVSRLVERYPELKANTNFMNLQGQLRDIENELSQARKYYNATVREYNVLVRSFPSLIIAKMVKAQERIMFTLEDNPEERENVKVQF